MKCKSSEAGGPTAGAIVFIDHKTRIAYEKLTALTKDHPE